MRFLLVGAGALFFLLFLVSAPVPPIGMQVLNAVLAVLCSVWCVRMARAGLVIDQNGVTRRSLGRTRRTPWRDVEEVAIRDARGSDGTDLWSIVLRMRDGKELLLHSTTSRDRERVAEVGQRLLAMRAAVLTDENKAELIFRAGNPDHKYGEPLGSPVLGPDEVPVLLRLRGPDGVHLDWERGTVQPEGLVLAMVAAVPIALGTLVSFIVRRIRKRPAYRLTVVVGGAAPRTYTLPFVSHARAVRHARALAAAIGQDGVTALGH